MKFQMMLIYERLDGMLYICHTIWQYTRPTNEILEKVN